jgi:amino acid transporter
MAQTDKAHSVDTNSNSAGAGFGTFAGVFTPSILTILGVIMYLRFGWVLGQVGLIGTLVIVTLSTAITFLTALSIASIATDQHVRTGGAYYMISRSLGIETGGAVGIPLFLAQALSVALYTIGFAESVCRVFPQFDAVWTGMITTVLVGGLALYSAKIAIRSQFFIMAAIVLSLASLLLGEATETPDVSLWEGAGSVGFWSVFAVFFPAVTGIMAGVNMSGDLKNAKRSIPRGTFLAIGVGYLIYMLLPILLSQRASAESLIQDPLIMRRIAFWGDAILLGVWGATLSSAIGSILGAPRVLQALARDKVLPNSLRWLGKGKGADDNPRAGTWFTLGLALIAVYFGNLNIVAPVLTMFFLTTYGVLNISASIEKLLGSPSFRPTFKVHWFFSFLGAMACIAVMLLINSLATIIAVLFMFLLFIWLQRRELQTTWGDVRQGLWMAISRSALLRVRRTADPKNWRPHILVLSGAPTKRWHLVELGHDLSQNRSLMTVATAISKTDLPIDRQLKMERNIREYLLQRGINSLVRVYYAKRVLEGTQNMISTYGLGQITPNTVLMGASENPANLEEYTRLIEYAYALRKNVLIARNADTLNFKSYRRIDIWWGGLKANGGLMIVLAHLLQRSINWKGTEVNVKMLTQSEKAAEGASLNLSGLFREMRVDHNEMVIHEPKKEFYEVLNEHSNGADLVMLGMAVPAKDFDYKAYYLNLSQKTKNLPSTLFVLASQEVAFGEVLS